MVKSELIKFVMDVEKINLRNLSVGMVLCGSVVTANSVYASQSGKNKKDISFYDNLRAEMQSKNENCLSLGILMVMLKVQ